jgi:osmotically-inducible protein OsmY
MITYKMLMLAGPWRFLQRAARDCFQRFQFGDDRMLRATAAVDEDDKVTEVNRQDSLADKVCERVSNSSYAALRRVQVNHEAGKVTLQGRVPTYFLKQVAQSIAAEVVGARCVVNNLEVNAAVSR